MSSLANAVPEVLDRLPLLLDATAQSPTTRQYDTPGTAFIGAPYVVGAGTSAGRAMRTKFVKHR